MTKLHSSRRGFLKQAAFGAGGLLLGSSLSRRALAQTGMDDHRFVFAYFEGGWDILLGLDPRGTQTSPETDLIDPGWGALPMNYQNRGIRTEGALRVGPAMAPEMVQHLPDCSIVNAIGMDTASHEVGRRYFITGRFPRGIAAVGSSTASEISAQLVDAQPIPNMSAGVESYATGLPAHATALNVNGLTDLVVALTPFVEIDPTVVSAMQAYQDEAPGCGAQRLDRNGLASHLLRNQKRARTYIESRLDSLFDLGRQDAEMETLRQRYGIGGGDTTNPSSPEILSFVAGQALKNEVSRVVSVRVAQNLDTHSNWAADQPSRQERGWRALASLMTDLKATPLRDTGKSMFDVTTFVVFSEFGRTPLFNNLQGRDHFLGNSCLVAGPGMKRNTTIGQSAVRGMMPYSTDLDSGAGVPSPTDAQLSSGRVQTLSPKHVLATVLESAGLNHDYLRTEPIQALLT
ncbi:MAG: DUF1501 domain-containing protein [Deltaproteobacteria bacterium]